LEFSPTLTTRILEALKMDPRDKVILSAIYFAKAFLILINFLDRLMPQYNQSSSNINSLYDVIEYKANVDGLIRSIHQSLKHMVFETDRKFCKSNLIDSS
jgi:hypothetical protein